MALNILVVDDNYPGVICADMGDALEERDITFHQARSGNKAIAKVRERDFDLVILDSPLGFTPQLAAITINSFFSK